MIINRNKSRPEKAEVLTALEKMSRAAQSLLEETLPNDHWYDENPELYVVAMLYFVMRDCTAMKQYINQHPEADISKLVELINYALPDIEQYHDIGGEEQYIDAKHLDRFKTAFRNLQFMNALKQA